MTRVYMIYTAEWTDRAQVRHDGVRRSKRRDQILAFVVGSSTVLSRFVLVFTLILYFYNFALMFFFIYIYISVCLFVIVSSFSSCVFNYVPDILTCLSQNHTTCHSMKIQRLRVKHHRPKTQFKGMFDLRLEDRETWLTWSRDIILPLCYYIYYNSRVADILGYIGSSMLSCK